MPSPADSQRVGDRASAAPGAFSREDWRELGSRIAAKRRERGVSQAGLASAVGITHSYVQKIEYSARHPSLALVLGVCRALEAKVEDITAGLGPQEPIASVQRSAELLTVRATRHLPSYEIGPHKGRLIAGQTYELPEAVVQVLGEAKYVIPV